MEGGQLVKKVIAFLSVVIVIFAAIWVLNVYQQREKLKGNPYKKSSLHSETIAQLDDPNYQNIVLPEELAAQLKDGNDETVYFYSPTCSYCRKTTPIVVPLSNDLGIDLKLFNLLEFEEGWEQYDIEATPTIIHFDNGKESARIVGYNEKEVFEQWFEENVLK